MECAVTVLLTSLLRAGMMASRLNHRERVIPALTDHLEDKGGVIGPNIQRPTARLVNQRLQSSSASRLTAGAARFISAPPKVFKALLAQFRIAGGDGAMAEPVLNGARVVPGVGQRVAAGVAQHVHVDLITDGEHVSWSEAA